MPRRSSGISTPTTRSGIACTSSFTEPELVELGCMIGLTLGQQSWLRLLNIEHHQVMAGTDASMAPGYERHGQAQDDQGAARTIGPRRKQPGRQSAA